MQTPGGQWSDDDITQRPVAVSLIDRSPPSPSPRRSKRRNGTEVVISRTNIAGKTTEKRQRRGVSGTWTGGVVTTYYATTVGRRRRRFNLADWTADADLEMLLELNRQNLRHRRPLRRSDRRRNPPKIKKI